jgi:hypothetical protein
MFGSKLVHFTEYSNIFPKIVVTGLTANFISKLNFFLVYSILVVEGITPIQQQRCGIQKT